ncbi:MAG: tetratricopeptide repeat protein [Myxococcota bacterium]
MRALLHDDEVERLRQIFAAIDGGQLEDAWAALDAWGDEAPYPVQVVRFALHNEGAALRALTRTDDRVALRLAVDLAQRAGLEPEAQTLLRTMLREPDADLLRRAVRPRVKARAYASALPLLERLAASGSKHDQRALAECLAGLGDPRTSAAWSFDPASASALRSYVRVGDWDALARSQEGRARLALYRGQALEAARLSEEPWVHAAASILQGRLADASPLLEHPSEDPEVLAWQGALLLRQGDVDAGRKRLDDAMAHAGRFHLPALLLRLLSEMEGDLALGEDFVAEEGPGLLGGEVREGLLELWGRDPIARAGTLAEVVLWLRRSVERLAGNYSPDATYLRDGELVRFRTQMSPREASRWALELIRVLTPEEVLAALDDASARYPKSSSPRVHRGELQLWLGNYTEAAQDFEAVLERHPGTRWAYIGLAAVRMLEGEVAESLRVHEEGVRVMGSAIGSIFIYRGEALLRAGRLREAAADFDEAVKQSPLRVSVWLNRALLAIERGEDAEADLAKFLSYAPVLISDAGGRHLFAGSRDGVREVLLHARTLMQGNRSSSCATYCVDGHLRLAVRPREGSYLLRRQELLEGVRRRLR